MIDFNKSDVVFCCLRNKTIPVKLYEKCTACGSTCLTAELYQNEYEQKIKHFIRLQKLNSL